MPLGPPHQADDYGIDVERPLGQPVLVPIGIGAVADALEHSVGHELAQAIGEDVARDSEIALQLAVAADPKNASRRIRKVQRSLKKMSTASSTESRGGRAGVWFLFGN
jgi:hypothetical protein